MDLDKQLERAEVKPTSLPIKCFSFFCTVFFVFFFCRKLLKVKFQHSLYERALSDCSSARTLRTYMNIKFMLSYYMYV